jgi:Uma2 family endonuclease
MSRPAERHYSLEEYFATEESSAIKHEYFDGEILAMAGASLRHNRIAGNVFAALRSALRSSECEVFGSDLRLRTPGGLLTYPDDMVICGEVELSSIDRLDTVLNPVVIVEVLSPSTEAYDRGEKLRLYREIPTLRDYLLIEQDEVLVEHYRIEPPGNAAPLVEFSPRRHTERDDVIRLSAINVDLTVQAIYERVEMLTRE